MIEPSKSVASNAAKKSKLASLFGGGDEEESDDDDLFGGENTTKKTGNKESVFSTPVRSCTIPTWSVVVVTAHVVTLRIMIVYCLLGC